MLHILVIIVGYLTAAGLAILISMTFEARLITSPSSLLSSHQNITRGKHCCWWNRNSRYGARSSPPQNLKTTTTLIEDKYSTYHESFSFAGVL